MALVHRQVRRLAQGAAGVVQARAQPRQFDEVAKILNGGVAPAFVQVADEGGAVGGDQHGAASPDDHIALRIAGVLREFRRRVLPDEGATQPLGETGPLAIDVGAAFLQDRQGLRIVAEIDADLLQRHLGVLLDQRQARLVHELVVGDLALDERHGRWRLSPRALPGPSAPGPFAPCLGH